MEAMLDEMERQQLEAAEAGGAVDAAQAKAQREAVARIMEDQKKRRQAKVCRALAEAMLGLGLGLGLGSSFSYGHFKAMSVLTCR